MNQHVTDWTKYGHEQECTGVHYAAEITTTCPEHPHMNRVDVQICCHRQRLQVISDRSLSDGSRIVRTITGCKPIEQSALGGL